MEAALKEVFNVHRNIVRGLRRDLQKVQFEKKDTEQWLDCNFTEIVAHAANLHEKIQGILKYITVERCSGCRCQDGHVSRSKIAALEQHVHSVEEVLSIIVQKIQEFVTHKLLGYGHTGTQHITLPTGQEDNVDRTEISARKIIGHAVSHPSKCNQAALRLQLTRPARKKRRYTEIDSHASKKCWKARAETSDQCVSEQSQGTAETGDQCVGQQSQGTAETGDHCVGQQSQGTAETCDQCVGQQSQGTAETCDQCVGQQSQGTAVPGWKSREKKSTLPAPFRVPQTLAHPGTPVCLVSETYPDHTGSPHTHPNAEPKSDTVCVYVVPETLQCDADMSSVDLSTDSDDSHEVKATLDKVYKIQSANNGMREENIVITDSVVFKSIGRPNTTASLPPDHLSLSQSMQAKGLLQSPVFNNVRCVDTSFGVQSPTLFDDLPDDTTEQSLLLPVLRKNDRILFGVISPPDTSGLLLQTVEDEVCVVNDGNESAGDVTIDPNFQCLNKSDIQEISQSQNNISIGHGIPRHTHDKHSAFDRMPARKADKYAYVEVVRKQNDRRKLQGFSCKECSKYYSAVGLTEAEQAERISLCSRHRARQAPPSTPEHFWSVGFPDTDWQQTAGP